MAKTVFHHSLSLVVTLAWAPILLTEATAQPAQAYEPYVETTKAWGPDGLVDKPIPTITFAGPWQSRASFFGRKEIRVVSLVDTADAEVDEVNGNADISASMPWRTVVQLMDMHDLSVARVPRDLDRKVGGHGGRKRSR